MLLLFVLVLLTRPRLSLSREWPFCKGNVHLDKENVRNMRWLSMMDHNVDNIVIPERFDAREKWPNCSTIQTIVDQGDCGGCWAFSGALVMSDRLCIATEGKWQRELSIQDLLECCLKCLEQDKKTGKPKETELGGCNGGNTIRAFQFWVDEGVVTGKDGCKPLAPGVLQDKPRKTCVKECNESYHEHTYQEDKQFAKKAMVFIPSKVNNDLRHLQAELMLYGPVSITVISYEFFQDYKKGEILICDEEHIEENEVGVRHAVRLIGWDVIDEIPVWTFANSWGTSWGNDGYAYIRRGKNDCGIEDDFSAKAARVFYDLTTTTSENDEDDPDRKPTTIQTWSGGSQCLGWIIEVFSLVWLLM